MKKYARLSPWYRSIIVKQILIFLLTVVPILGVATYVFTVYQNDAMNAIEELSLSRDESICYGLFDDLSNYEFKMHNFYNDGDLYLLSDMWDQYEISERSRRIVDIQEKLYWMGTGETYSNVYRMYLMRRDIMIYTNGYQTIDDGQRAVIEELIRNNQTLHVSDGDFYIYVKSLSENATGLSRFVGCVKVSRARFQRMMGEIGSDGQTQSLFMVNGEVYQKVNATPETEDMLIDYYRQNAGAMGASATANLSRDGKEYFCTVVHSANHDAALITLRNYDAVFARTAKGVSLLLAMLAVSVVAIALFVMYISRYVKRPIRILGNAFSLVNEDAARLALIQDTARDEFQFLYASFNDMSSRLSSLIRDHYLQTIELQRAELKQLQAQIDPHFLYNTLFILQRKVIREDYAGTAELSGLLGEYFRYVNRGDRDFVPLRDEVEHALAYIRIQRMRFAGRFQFLYEAYPETLKDVPVPRMILQPIAENSIGYGLKDVEEGGVIALRFAREGDRLLVMIEDSGSITDAEIARMNRDALERSDTTVVSSTVNIMRRLRLYYGEGYGLRFERSGYGGLRAVVVIDCTKGA